MAVNSFTVAADKCVRRKGGSQVEISGGFSVTWQGIMPNGACGGLGRAGCQELP